MKRFKLEESKIKKIFNLFNNGQSLAIFLTLIVLSLLMVLFRMKSLELDYKISAKSKSINKVLIKNKEFKANKAKLLSTKNLRKMANRHKLKGPSQKQIIVIP